MKILFVCLGNICRSPLAEGIAKHEFKKHGINAEIYSAGTSDYHNKAHPCYKSIIVGKKNNIDISRYKSSYIGEFDLASFDMVVAMDESNMSDLRKFKDINLFKLGNFGLNGEDIPDPYYMKGEKGMQIIFDNIRKGVLGVMKHISKLK